MSFWLYLLPFSLKKLGSGQFSVTVSPTCNTPPHRLCQPNSITAQLHYCLPKQPSPGPPAKRWKLPALAWAQAYVLALVALEQEAVLCTEQATHKH